jgi:hypothetical protein
VLAPPPKNAERANSPRFLDLVFGIIGLMFMRVNAHRAHRWLDLLNRDFGKVPCAPVLGNRRVEIFEIFGDAPATQCGSLNY